MASLQADNDKSPTQVRLRLKLLLALVCLVATGHACTSANDPSGFRTAPTATLKLCVISSPPDLTPKAGVTIADDTLLTPAEATNKLQGLTLDMINAVFGQVLQWPFTVRYFDIDVTAFSQVAYKVRMGMDCDVAVQSYFISASRDLCLPSCPSPPAGTVFHSDVDYEQYLCCLDFSHAYYNGGWAFMSQLSSEDTDYLAVFFQRDIVQAICACVIVMFFVAHLIWAIERAQFGKSLLLTNPKEGFSRYYLDGLKDGVWFSSTVLMNGVVNAEKTIITPFGRLVATAWVLFGILMSAFVTAVIAASLTTAQLTTSALMTAKDVAGKTVCTAGGFYDSFFDSSFPGVGVQKVIKPNIVDCFPLLSTGKVDAVFTIREAALGYFAEGSGAGLVIAPIVKSQAYGMVWSQNWDYDSWVNEALLLWQQNVVATQPPYADAIQKWYYGDSHVITYGGNSQGTEQQWNWGLIGTAIGLVVLYMGLQCFVYVAHWHMKRHGVQPEDVTNRHAKSETRQGSGKTGSGKTASNKSFFLKAATAIAAPPDAMTLSLDGSHGQTLSFGRALHSFHQPAQGEPLASLRGVPPPPPAFPRGASAALPDADGAHPADVLSALQSSGFDVVALADMVKKLSHSVDVLVEAQQAQHAPQLSPSKDAVVTLTAQGRVQQLQSKGGKGADDVLTFESFSA